MVEWLKGWPCQHTRSNASMLWDPCILTCDPPPAYSLVLKEFLQRGHHSDLWHDLLHRRSRGKISRNNVNITGDFDVLWYFLWHFIEKICIVNIVDIVIWHVNLQCFLPLQWNRTELDLINFDCSDFPASSVRAIFWQTEGWHKVNFIVLISVSVD